MISTYFEFEEYLKNLSYRPKLLLHSCCGPCSSSVLELLTKYFDVDVYYYNPNIFPASEYVIRKDTQLKLIDKLNDDVGFIEGEYNYDDYKNAVIHFENDVEGGIRCYKCIKLRMTRACIYAKDNGYDFFTTTLSVSPHKNSKMINEIGYELEKEFGISYLYSDFKKRDGYKRSIILSKEFDLYRQDYCGCEYSIRN